MFTVPYLGHGVGLRAKHYGHVLEHGVGDVDWMEVISENFFEPGGRPWCVLEAVRREVPVVLHGVSLAIGDAPPLSNAYLASLIAVAQRVQPAWISDHLCWGTHGGRYAYDLLPLPYTEEAIAHVATRVIQVQEKLRRQILLENVSSYVTFAHSTLTEWEFISEVARRADCGILLDVNNVFVNAKNHGFSAQRYIDEVDATRVAQIHLAGHTDYGTYILDSHQGPVPTPVWELYRRAVRRVGNVASLIEWDEAVPDYETLLAERQRAISFERTALQND